MTAWRWGQVLGYINVAFETTKNGRILAYSGGPIPMTSETKQDKALQKKIDAWREPFDAFSKEVVGIATGVLDGSSCQKGECRHQKKHCERNRVADIVFHRHSRECNYRCDIRLQDDQWWQDRWSYHECWQVFHCISLVLSRGAS